MSPPATSASDRTGEASLYYPAGILEEAGIKVCIVGNAATMLFGSHHFIGDLDLVIADEQFELALSILHDHGFSDIDFEDFQLGVMPALGKPGGWVARRIQYPSSPDIAALSPASCWHLGISPDTTFLPFAAPYRFPHFLAYVEVLLEQRPELEVVISPGDRFFLDFYMKQWVRPGKLKVLRLRKQIIEGSISAETAREVVPRPDLARKRIREKYLARKVEQENYESNTPIS
ncbi:hypothetical protein L873DRAFT_1794369 [Choiromyces venosus 120613-1]|uniref:Nucleotidyltransferase family protein n=1 Tax=Choiromyces venosus 120613-1 TaxID=1336337 RepID=A0A3N4J2B6_9PEZI|nr:hypothetical protein L873DRAFT_1794369 [Choiromyces venosus 120613-1]